jgi:SAM-dependent methyltransferase
MTQHSTVSQKSCITLSSLLSTWNWNLSIIDTQPWVKNTFFKLRATRYPIKLLRYWFMYNLIREEQIRRRQPLRVCEIGLDQGQMLHFTRDSQFHDIACWVGVDHHLKTVLQESAYTKQIEANVDRPDFILNDKYDVIIVLHLLEHLFEPEELVQRLSNSLTQGGVIIGGFPVTAKCLASYWQKKIRRTASKFGHVSVFSPHRVKDMANRCGLSVDFMSGAFLIRKSGSFLENCRIWLRFNLLWGGLFPSLGGEIYWRMRKETIPDNET